MALTVNCTEFANIELKRQLAKNAAQLKLQQKEEEQHSLIDFAIGSLGDPFVPAKIKLMRQLQAEGYKVHIDYSDDMRVGLGEKFLDDNAVRFLVQVQSDSGNIRFTDRSGVANSNASPLGAFREYDNLK